MSFSWAKISAFLLFLMLSASAEGQQNIPAPVQKEIDSLQNWMQSELAEGNQLDTAKLNSWNRKIKALQASYKDEQKKMFANPKNSGGVRLKKSVSAGSSLTVPDGKVWTVKEVSVQNMDEPYSIVVHDYNGKSFNEGEKIKFSLQNPALDLLGGSALENKYKIILIENNLSDKD